MMTATNNVKAIDKALRRQFDRIIELGFPTENTIRDLLRCYSKGYRYDLSIDFQQTAKVLHGYSFAEIKSLPNEVALHAFDAEELFIRKCDMDFAITEFFAKKQVSDKAVKFEYLPRLV